MKKILFVAIFFTRMSSFSQIIGNGVIDIDNNNYQTVIIGNQEWMSENLRTTKYSNGDGIGTTPFFNYNYFSENQPKYQWDVPGFQNYGRHYTWFAAIDVRNICPNGWKVPSANDWETLIAFIGGYNSGGKLKEIGNVNWDTPNSDATNSSGFNGLPSGYHHFYGGNNAIGFNSFFLSNTEYSSDDGFFIYLSTIDSHIYTNGMSPSKKLGMSCRCIKNTSLGLNNNSIQGLKLYPNPSNSLINIQTSNSAVLDKISITDLMGNTVIEQTQNTNQVSVEKLATGVYILNGYSRGNKFQEKFIKE